MSTAKFNEWQNPDGTTNYKVRAWVNFNGTGTVAIRAAGNVSSITDNGTGNYTVNFTTAMPDANYSCQVDAAYGTVANGSSRQGTRTTTSVGVNSFISNGAVTDSPEISVAIFR